MDTHPRLHVMTPIVVAVLLALILIVLWAAVPEDLQGAVLLFGIAAEVVLYGTLYMIQRRRHW